jgi:hypothetical protein
MPKSMVGLLAAVGATMFALAPFAHGVLAALIIATGAAATGLAAYGALCPASGRVPSLQASLTEDHGSPSTLADSTANKKKSSMSVTYPVQTMMSGSPIAARLRPSCRFYTVQGRPEGTGKGRIP